MFFWGFLFGVSLLGDVGWGIGWLFLGEWGLGGVWVTTCAGTRVGGAMAIGWRGKGGGLRGEGDLVGGDFLEGFYVEFALGGLDAVAERFKGVVGVDGDLGLGENGAVVVHFID